MGGWKLEVGRMFMYMMFPVLTFHYFNQPQYYEDAVAQLKRKLYPPQSKEVTELLNDKLHSVREKRELEELKQMIAKHNQ